jgi:Fungal chitosanase of glycosyl hydrolase group 75
MIEHNVITTIDESIVRQIVGEKIFVFRSEFKVDADGSPRAYHPDNIGLDWVANAGNSDDWYGIATDSNNIPLVQSATDPAPGYYVSTTALGDKTKKDSDPLRYVDAEVIPYIALPGKLIESGKLAQLGDFCMVVNTNNRTMTGAIVADVGNNEHIGEGSIALAKKLGIKADPKHGGCKDGILYVVFPGTTRGYPIGAATIEQVASTLFKTWGGNEKLQALYPKLLPPIAIDAMPPTTAIQVPNQPLPLAKRSESAPLSFGWACLKRMLLLGWDLTHHEHKTRKGEYWIQWGIEDITSLGVPLPNDFWDDEYNDRYCTGIWIPAKNSFVVTLNCAATVEPGVYYTTHPMNPKGAARLDNEIQFKAWGWGMHGNAVRYRAMVQKANLSYTRDLNQDGFRTGDKAYTTSDNYINLHHGFDSNTIDRNGAACQVVKREADHDFRNDQADQYPHPEDDYFAYGILDGAKLAAFWKSFG